MAWRSAGDTPLHDIMIIKFFDAFTPHYCITLYVCNLFCIISLFFIFIEPSSYVLVSLVAGNTSFIFITCGNRPLRNTKMRHVTSTKRQRGFMHCQHNLIDSIWANLYWYIKAGTTWPTKWPIQHGRLFPDHIFKLSNICFGAVDFQWELCLDNDRITKFIKLILCLHNLFCWLKAEKDGRDAPFRWHFCHSDNLPDFSLHIQISSHWP